MWLRRVGTIFFVPEERALVSRALEVFTQNDGDVTTAYYRELEERGIKFVSELGDKQIREIRDKGGKVVVIQQDCKPPDLQVGREQCKAFQASK
jgi:hypothetical protein